jgi:hypothetical protein
MYIIPFLDKVKSIQICALNKAKAKAPTGYFLSFPANLAIIKIPTKKNIIHSQLFNARKKDRKKVFSVKK